MEKGRIIFTVTNDLTYDQRMIRICTSLSEAGYRVTLTGRQQIHSIPLDRQVFEQRRLRCYFQKGKLFYLEFNCRLFFYLLMERFDIVCGIDLDTILPAWCVSFLKNKPCVYDAHEYFTEVPEVKDRFFTKKIWETVARLAIPRMDACYTVGEKLAEIMAARYKKSFAVICNMPFHTILKDIPEKKTPPVIFYQGALNEGRGLENMIEAMKGLEGFELWIAGEGDLSNVLRGRVKKNNLSGKVKFLGKIRPQELKEITPAVWLGLNLLENRGLSYYYSLANKCFDYVQAEVPVMQMNFPEYKRLNEQHEVAVLIDNTEPETILKAIHALNDDPALYQKLVDNCHIAKSDWIWEKQADKLLAIYQTLND